LPLALPLPTEQDVTAAARDLVEIVRQLWAARDPRSAVFVMELFRGSPTARNKAAVSTKASKLKLEQVDFQLSIEGNIAAIDSPLYPTAAGVRYVHVTSRQR
jgi:hypothetical protein